MYIYQQTPTGWVRHNGPETAALADPVRGSRGKGIADVESVTDEVVAALDSIRLDGPPGKDGSRGWQAFDWQSECRLYTVAVYATAGMRFAEQQHPAQAVLLWSMLNRKLSKRAGQRVSTRTLSGFEEGLYAWLATREGQVDGYFGIAEMGGVSAQISFPCPGCAASRLVSVKGTDTPMVSYSFPGLGQDEVWKQNSRRAECKWAAGLENEFWKTSDCTDGLGLPENTGKTVRRYVEQADIQRWYLAGAFRYSKPSDMENYCRNDTNSGYKPESACFRALYQPYFLYLMGVPASSELSTGDWTLGAAICIVSDCLAKAGPPECRWSGQGCAE